MAEPGNVPMGEVQMWHHIGSIAQSLNRIANMMEGQERRARENATIAKWYDSLSDPDKKVVVKMMRSLVALEREESDGDARSAAQSTQG